MYHIIVNKKSQSGRGEKLWPVIEGELERRRTEFRVYPTKYRGSARETAARLTAKGVWNPDDVLLAIGGDGTANEAVDGITSLSDVKFGYIPTGSGNDFARGAGIPSDPLQALEAVLKGEEKEINIGTALLGSQKRRFLVSTGIGFDAGICHEALASKIKNTLNRLHLGKLTYVMIALRQLFYLEPFILDAALENGEHRSFENVLFAVAMNFPYEGGGFCFCPEADGTDDLLDVMVVSNLANGKSAIFCRWRCLDATRDFLRYIWSGAAAFPFRQTARNRSTWTENRADTARRKGSDWKRSVSAFWATG